ncbi:metal cation symporter ZIP14-like isoform X1 [Scylla paramamosain]|uniref:metal cation symporter ZIP14-like isoform X1 n=2 Tax=Scylla paramamosain TaxID=85552 RepID=UPI003082CA83
MCVAAGRGRGVRGRERIRQPRHLPILFLFPHCPVRVLREVMWCPWRLAMVVVVTCVVQSVCVSGQSLPHPSTAEWNSTHPLNITDFPTVLWYGFSSNKVNFTRADLQRLVECSLGRHQCPPLHQALPSLALSSCDKESEGKSSHCRLLKACTVDDLLSAIDHDEESLTVEDLRELLPVIIYMGQKGDSCTAQQLAMTPKSKPKQSEVWGYGILFVTLISGCSLAGVSVLPLMAHKFYQQLLTLLVGLAVGSLAASSLFHLIPQAFKLNVKDEHHGYLFVSLFVLVGVWGFFMVERIIKIIITHQARKEKGNFPPGQSDQDILCNNMKDVPAVEQGKVPPVVSVNGAVSLGKAEESITPQSSCGPDDVDLIYASQRQVIRASFGHNERPDKASAHTHALEFRQGQDSVIRTVAWMIIFGDGFHNFIDGVSIGAAFSESILTGISISLAVMCEELPHELGDFAVLLNAGMTMKQAVSYNFLSATTCYLGLFLGILLGEFTQDNTAVFAVAAGMFLYIALVDMVPEMNEVASKAAEGGWRSAIHILMYQNLGIFIGIGSLFCLAYFQDSMVLT